MEDGAVKYGSERVLDEDEEMTTLQSAFITIIITFRGLTARRNRSEGRRRRRRAKSRESTAAGRAEETSGAGAQSKAR